MAETITIRGKVYSIGRFTDDDVRILSGVIDPSLDYFQRHQNACCVLKRLFPELPEDLTEGNHLWLHNTELAALVGLLQNFLLQDSSWSESLNGISARLHPEVKEAIQNAIGFAQTQTDVKPPVDKPPKRRGRKLGKKEAVAEESPVVCPMPGVATAE